MENRKPPFLLLIDFDARIAGIENLVGADLGMKIQTTTDHAKLGVFREATDALAACCEGRARHIDQIYGSEPYQCGGWNPRGWHGGTMTGSAVGLLAVVQAIAGWWAVDRSRIGTIVRMGSADFVIRPCPAYLMPLRLWERYNTFWRRRAAKEELFGLEQARRLCFDARRDPRPRLTYFAKGTTSVEPPAEAVARIGGSESSTVVFVDKFARPVAAYRAAGGWDSHYAASIHIPDRLDWRRLRSLGKSTRDIVFGVHG